MAWTQKSFIQGNPRVYCQGTKATVRRIHCQRDNWTIIQRKPAVSVEEVFMGDQATRWCKGEVRRKKEPNWGFEKWTEEQDPGSRMLHLNGTCCVLPRQAYRKTRAPLKFMGSLCVPQACMPISTHRSTHAHRPSPGFTVWGELRGISQDAEKKETRPGLEHSRQNVQRGERGTEIALGRMSDEGGVPDGGSGVGTGNA